MTRCWWIVPEDAERPGPADWMWKHALDALDGEGLVSADKLAELAAAKNRNAEGGR